MSARVGVSVTGSIVCVRVRGVVVAIVGMVIVRVAVLACAGGGGTSFKVGSVGVGRTVIVGVVAEQASALTLVAAAKRSDGIGVLVSRGAVVAEIVSGLDNESASLSRVTEDRADTVLTTATALGNRATDSAIIVVSGSPLAADRDGSDSITDSRFILVSICVVVSRAVGNSMAVCMTVSAVTVRVTVTAVRVTMIVEKKQANQVARKTERADNNNELGVGHLGNIDKSLDRLHEDAKAKCEQEDTVDESPENLCTLPTVTEAMIRGLGGKLNGPKRDDERHDIVEHVERIGNESERADSIPGDNFDKEEDDIDHQEGDDAGLFA